MRNRLSSLLLALLTGFVAEAQLSVVAKPNANGPGARLQWTPVTNASRYLIRRTSAYPTWEASPAEVLAPQTTYAATTSANAAYVFSVVAQNAQGQQLAVSNNALVTTFAFSQPTLVAGDVIEARHVGELRTMVAAARLAAGVTAFSWTYAQTDVVRREDVVDLRSALNGAIQNVGLTPLAYTDPVLDSSIPSKKVHIDELRRRAQGFPLPAPIVITALGVDRPSPQLYGTAITWSATASGGMTPLEYRFWRKPVSAPEWTLSRDWGTSNLYGWTPTSVDTGDWQIRVQARSVGEVNSESELTSGAYTVIAPLVVTALTPGVPSPKPYGTPILWTPQATGGVQPWQYRYSRKRFADSSWATPVQDWSTTSTYSWTPLSTESGSWQVRVEMRSANGSGTESDRTADFTVYEPVQVTGLVSNEPSPQPYGTIVTWTPQVTGGLDPKQYSYSRKRTADSAWGATVQDWGLSPTYNWTPLVSDVGTWDIRVNVRSAGVTTSEAERVSTGFTVRERMVVTALTPDKASPQPHGTSITWTPQVAGGGGAPECRYSRRRVTAYDEPWTVVQGWSSTATYSWTPANVDLGLWQLRVDVRATGSASAESLLETNFTVAEPITVTSLTASSLSPHPQGTPVTWSPHTTGGIAPLEYQYSRKRVGDTDWGSPAQDWSTTSSYTWTPSPADTGSWVVRVNVRNAGSAVSETQRDSASFTVRDRIAVVSLTPDELSPQPFGTTITWTGEATGGAPPVQYRFERKPASETTWIVVRDWSTNKTYTWTPALADARLWDVRVTARSGAPFQIETASLTDDYEVAASAQTESSIVYGDPNWPEVVTFRSSASLLADHQRSESYVYDSATGNVTSQTTSGFDPTTGAAITRTTTTALYDGLEDAAFDPCDSVGGTCAFESGWVTLPQPIGLRKSVDGPRAGADDTTTYVYYPIDSAVPANAQGRLAAIRNAAGHITRMEAYDVFGNATKSIDPNGVVIETAHDLFGRLRTSTLKGVPGCDTTLDPLCDDDIVTTTRLYEPASGPLAIEVGPLGEATTYEYDARGRTTAILRGELLGTIPATASAAIAAATWYEKMLYEYSASTGRKTAERIYAKDGTSWIQKKYSTFAYDASGHMTTLTHADNSTVVYAYERGQLVSVKDENHTTPNTFNDYDGSGRLEQVKQTLATASGGFITTTYGYDAHGNLVSVTDPNGNTTTYVYDDFGQMLKQTSPVTGVTTYSYDTAGDLETTSDASGAVTTRTYDAIGRALQSTSVRSGVPSETVTWTYDGSSPFGKGRLDEMTDPTGSTLYGYNRRGLLASEEKTIDSATYTTRFQYDASGNRAAIVYPSNRTVTFTHDFARRPTGAAAGASTLVGSATYLPFGPRVETVFGNGTTQTQTHDLRYRPSTNQLTAGGFTLAAYTYTHDSVGNITAIADDGDASFSRTFGYDDLNRLTTANSGTSLWGAGSYSYDAMGNLITSMLGTATSSFVYQSPLPKLTSATENGASRSVTYDSGGNETNVGDTSFAYSARNSMSSDVERQYGYDGRGIRTTTTYPSLSGTPHRYSLYSPELNLLVETETSTNTTPSVAYEYVWFAGQPLAQLTPTATLYYFNDHLGTPTAVTDATGAVAWRAEYEPYGNVVTLRSGATLHQPLRFPGQEAADGTGQSYNIFRWYRSGWGRYTQSDPVLLYQTIGEEGRWYGYGLENPLRFIDPKGLYTVDGSCKRCDALDPKVTKNISEFILEETSAWCRTKLNGVADVSLRNCLRESCRSGRVECMVCDTPGIAGDAERTGLEWVRRFSPQRTVRICSNFDPLYSGLGNAGSTVIHEWAHGCGYNSDNSLPGVPDDTDVVPRYTPPRSRRR